MFKSISLITAFCGMACPLLVFAVNAKTPELYKPFYVGISGGVGSTTWKGLVPSQENQNMALNISTPVYVQEGGQVYGAFAGYELTPYFALEGYYRRYPQAVVRFDDFSMYAFEHNQRVSFNTDTEALSLMAKVMLTIPNTIVRVYSSFGMAGVHRKDEITNLVQKSPAFGAGLTANVTQHVMVDLGFNYTAGYGESELNPAKTYIPFLYSVSIGLAYRI